MGVEHMLAEPFAEKQLGLLAVSRVRHEPDNIEPELRERAPHLVIPILGLDDDLVEPILHRPDFLLFSQRTEMTLAPPVGSRSADPLIEYSSAVELYTVFELCDEIREFPRAAALPPSEFDGRGSTTVG
jgi:hypothetical protein